MAETLAQEIAAAKAAAKAKASAPAQKPAAAVKTAPKPPSKQSALEKSVAEDLKRATNAAPTKAQIDAVNASFAQTQDALNKLVNPNAGYQTVTSTSGTTVTAPVDMIGGGFGATTYAPTYKPTTEDQAISAERRDAFKLIEDAFKGYGLEKLIPEIKKYMQGYIDEKGNKIMVGPNEAEVLLKETQAYRDRFAGNYDLKTGRIARGLNAYSPGEYIRAENEYSALFKEYGQTGFATQKEYADLIGGDISAVELNKRLKLATDAWDQADPMVKATLKRFYPEITDADAIGYFLKPEKKLPELQTKVAAAQIGGEAMRQGLENVSAMSAEEYAKAGITQEGARAGYADVAAVLPTATKLSQVYGEAQIPYTQRTAEEEFLLQQQSAAEKRARLKSLERAKFGGSSGIDTNISPFSSKGSRGAF